MHVVNRVESKECDLFMSMTNKRTDGRWHQNPQKREQPEGAAEQTVVAEHTSRLASLLLLVVRCSTYWSASSRLASLLLLVVLPTYYYSSTSSRLASLLRCSTSRLARLLLLVRTSLATVHLVDL